MTAGLPGTGIGGLFYMLLVLLMPVRETYLTLRGRSSISRWKNVGLHLMIALGILGSLLGAAWAIRQTVDLLQDFQLIGPLLRQTVVNASAVSSRTAAITSLAVLLTIIGGSAVLSLILPRRKPRPEASQPRASAQL